MVDVSPSIDALVPHRDAMLLIDTVIESTADSLRARAHIGPDHLFMVPGFGVPAWIGFEMMAQTVSAFDGLRRWRRGEKPTLGFLLGCRSYQCATDWLAVGAQLDIVATQTTAPGEIMSFNCTITRDGAALANAQMNVYQPRDLTKFLEGSCG